jgi:hypothetical protein
MAYSTSLTMTRVISQLVEFWYRANSEALSAAFTAHAGTTAS